jgi:hypothetical protein
MNIWQISNELSSILEEIENNDGELTPEIESELTITQDYLKDKIADYVNVIKTISNDIELIKSEEKRLKTLSDSKQKLVDRLKDVVITAINNFGDSSKSGSKFIDYGTGKVSIRNTKSVKVIDDGINTINETLNSYLNNLVENNQVYEQDILDKEVMSELITDKGIPANVNNYDNVNCNVNLSIPMKELMTNEDAYQVIKDILNYTSDYKIKAEVSKSVMKPLLEENPVLCPDISVMETNQNLVIK